MFFAAVAIRAQTPASATPKVTGGAELILVAKVVGQVTMTVGDKSTALVLGASVPQLAKINTAKDSSIVLAFSNGATTNLGPDSELVIQEFLQDPFSSTIKMADVTDEPSVSTTRLKLNHGELVGKVAHLKHDKGSTFVVETPAGAAGIRGTTFQIVFRPDPITGLTTFNLRTIEGSVAFGQPAGVTATGAVAPTTTTATPLAVPTGQEVTVTVDVTVNAAGQQVVTVQAPPTATAAIPPAVAAQVNQVATQVAVAVQQAVFTSAPPTTSASGTTTTTTTATISTGNGPPTTTTSTTTTTTDGGSKSTSTTTTSANGTKTTTTSNTTTATDGSKTTTIAAPEFTATVTTPPPPLTPGAGQH